MKLDLEKFASLELSQDELYPISGGSSTTKCGDYMTKSTGADGDTTNYDGDADFY